mmetsp:Transcript_103775/g.293967  ORF Transcript_103775/g.293967 Transcript_103775/m.293967 type:complete len:332 (-) Transcript_103775:384-1379(-)
MHSLSRWRGRRTPWSRKSSVRPARPASPWSLALQRDHLLVDDGEDHALVHLRAHRAPRDALVGAEPLVVVPPLRGAAVEPALVALPDGAPRRHGAPHKLVELAHAVVHVAPPGRGARVAVEVHVQGVPGPVLPELDAHALQLAPAPLREGDRDVDVLVGVDHGAVRAVLLPAEGGPVGQDPLRPPEPRGPALVVRGLVPLVAAGPRHQVDGALKAVPVRLEEVDLLAVVAGHALRVAVVVRAYSIEVRVEPAAHFPKAPDSEQEALAHHASQLLPRRARPGSVEPIPVPVLVGVGPPPLSWHRPHGELGQGPILRVDVPRDAAAAGTGFEF